MGNYDFSLDLESINTMSIIEERIEPESTVLEFGPANGRLTKHLKEQKKCEVTIVEIDETAGKEAAEYAIESFVGDEHGDIEKRYWKKTDSKFDYIIFADVLEHLNHPKDILFECNDFLKESGEILVSIPNISHNSIIIDLLKDKFKYDKAGLLDETHIHFFTISSFLEMVNDCQLGVKDIIPIYSRVGNNEIDNSYFDVPTEISQYLRKRKEGSVYQYFVDIVKERNTECSKENITGLELEYDEELEMQIYYKRHAENFDDTRKISRFYYSKSRATVEFEIDRDAMHQIRIDPIECNGIIKIEKCRALTDDGEVDLAIELSNAAYAKDKYCVFLTDDPWIVCDIENIWSIKKILFEFKVLIYRRDISCLTNQIEYMSDLEKPDVESIHIPLLQATYEKQISEQQEYIRHLESDIKQLQKEIVDQKEEFDNYLKHTKKLYNLIKKIHKKLGK